MKKVKILGEAALLFLLLAGISAVNVASAAEVTGSLSSDLGATGGSIGGSVSGGGSTVSGTLTGGAGGGSSVSGTVSGGGGSSGGGNNGGGTVLGASTGPDSDSSGSSSTTTVIPGQVLGASTFSPSFPATGFAADQAAGNIIGSLLVLASLTLYGFYRATKNA